MIRMLTYTCFLWLVACGNSKTIYTDLEGRGFLDSGTAPVLRTKDRQDIYSWGHFSRTAIRPAYRIKWPDTVLVDWREYFDSTNWTDHEKRIAVGSVLPPINPRRQKYHMRFSFYPGDSVRIQVRVIPKSDCTHLLWATKLSTPAEGPCGVSDQALDRTYDLYAKGKITKADTAVFPE